MPSASTCSRRVCPSGLSRVAHAAGADRLAVDVAEELVGQRAGERLVRRRAGLVRVRRRWRSSSGCRTASSSARATPAAACRATGPACCRGRSRAPGRGHEMIGTSFWPANCLWNLSRMSARRAELEENVVAASACRRSASSHHFGVGIEPPVHMVKSRPPSCGPLPAGADRQALACRASSAPSFGRSVECVEVRERRLLAADRHVVQVVGDQDRIDLPPALARPCR